MRLAWALSLSALLAGPAAAEVTVRVSPGAAGEASQVELTARSAPLSEVLDRLSRQIGMKVVYEGAQPRQLVTLSLLGRTPAETVLGLLEGQGLNFALVADAAGTGVETLLVAGAAPVASGSTTSSSATGRSMPSTPFRRPLAPPPGSGPDAMGQDPEELDEDEGLFDDPADEELPLEAPEAADPAEQNAVPVPQGPGGVPQPQVPAQSFPVSPFAPQPAPYMPQPFPPLPPGVPGGPTTPQPEQPQDATSPPPS